jgi:DNA-binding NtrC family response regulator
LTPQRTVTLQLDPSGRPRAVSQPAFLLKVTKGPDRSRQLRVSTARVRIGGPGADFALTDPTVSALHCEIFADQSGFRVRDLGAKNGVALSDRRVREAWLSPTDDFTIGATTIRFKILDEVDERPLAPQTSFGKLIGSSVAMRQLYGQLQRVAESDTTVLIEGETGTGKDLAAEAIVAHGARRDRPLVVVDCAQLSTTLAESQLFGHEEGAFTGAIRAVPGAFERANGGTLVLDRVHELPLSLQPKLLGALERRAVQRVGGATLFPLDLRVIAAAQGELAREVNRGKFRADLYYRLAVVHLRMPALREHPEDIPELVAHFLEELPKGTALAPDALRALYAGTWSGNVRELRNAVERTALGFQLEGAPAATVPTAIDLDLPFRVHKDRVVRAFEHAYLSRLLEASNGNVSAAARRAGMNRMHLHELLERLGLARK